jgi:hypothetical protein
MATETSAIMMITDGEGALYERLSCLLGPRGFRLPSASPGQGLLRYLEHMKPRAAIIVPTKNSTWNSISTIPSIRKSNPALPLILLLRLARNSMPFPPSGRGCGARGIAVAHEINADSLSGEIDLIKIAPRRCLDIRDSGRSHGVLAGNNGDDR